MSKRWRVWVGPFTFFYVPKPPISTWSFDWEKPTETGPRLGFSCVCFFFPFSTPITPTYQVHTSVYLNPPTRSKPIDSFGKNTKKRLLISNFPNRSTTQIPTMPTESFEISINKRPPENMCSVSIFVCKTRPKPTDSFDVKPKNSPSLVGFGFSQHHVRRAEVHVIDGWYQLTVLLRATSSHGVTTRFLERTY